MRSKTWRSYRAEEEYNQRPQKHYFPCPKKSNILNISVMLELYWPDKICNVFREGKGNNKIGYYENVLDDNQTTKQR